MEPSVVLRLARIRAKITCKILLFARSCWFRSSCCCRIRVSCVSYSRLDSRPTKAVGGVESCMSLWTSLSGSGMTVLLLLLPLAKSVSPDQDQDAIRWDATPIDPSRYPIARLLSQDHLAFGFFTRVRFLSVSPLISITFKADNWGKVKSFKNAY